MLVGISGADLGVRGFITAYDINSGARVWRAYSVGPDAEILFDPDTTTSLGKPVGRDSSLKTWTGDQWTIGGGAVWGWFSYDPALDLVYYGTANPSTWNPDQRAGPDGKPIDQKWTMSIIARHPDTGLAAWAYQMTPFDEWDYDGINEMILADLDIGGHVRKALVHFDRNGFAYTLDRASGELLVAKPYDPDLNWSTGVEMDPSKPTYGRPAVVAAKSTFQNGPDTTTTGICPASLGAKNEQPAAFSPLTGLFYVPMNSLCMNYEPYKVNYAPGQPYAGATLSIYPQQGEGEHRPRHRLGCARGKDGLQPGRALFRLVGRAHDGRRHLLLRHARRLLEVPRPEGRQGAVPPPHAVRHHRQRVHVCAARQAVHRRFLGRRRLGRHRSWQQVSTSRRTEPVRSAPMQA